MDYSRARREADPATPLVTQGCLPLRRATGQLGTGHGAARVLCDPVTELHEHGTILKQVTTRVHEQEKTQTFESQNTDPEMLEDEQRTHQAKGLREHFRVKSQFTRNQRSKNTVLEPCWLPLAEGRHLAGREGQARPNCQVFCRSHRSPEDSIFGFLRLILLCVHHKHAAPAEARRRQQNFWNLQDHLGPCRSSSALHGAISPAPGTTEINYHGVSL